ncbi:MAG: peroxide stress protein YaaA [Rhodocyclales bacterium]|nr:peroxide stress protein YaaA [Rhodocyclales bacterium]
MIFVISPAKAMDFSSPAPVAETTLPEFLDRAQELVERLRRLTPAEVQGLMDLSDQLAALNVGRYAAWSPEHAPGEAKAALFAYAGDVYEGLEAASLPAAAIAWLQENLRILSGLYGVLRPLDRILPHRLEMGTRLENPLGRDLYAYWRETVTSALRRLLEAEAAAGRRPVLVNLASQEYFKAVDAAALAARVVSPVFEDWKGGRFKIISFYAKRARGLMARHAALKRAERVEDLLDFSLEGYAYDPAASSPDRPVFRRKAV